MSSTKKAPAPSEVTDLKDGDVIVTANGSIVALLHVPNPFGLVLPAGLVLKGGHGITNDKMDIRGAAVGSVFGMEPDGAYLMITDEGPEIEALSFNAAQPLRLVRRADKEDLASIAAPSAAEAMPEMPVEPEIELLKGLAAMAPGPVKDGLRQHKEASAKFKAGDRVKINASNPAPGAIFIEGTIQTIKEVDEHFGLIGIDGNDHGRHGCFWYWPKEVELVTDPK